MRVIARIERAPSGHYCFDGKVFDTFLGARREMTRQMKARRSTRHQKASSRPPASVLAAAS